VVQLQFADAFDGIVVFPLPGAAAATGREEAMQYGEKGGKGFWPAEAGRHWREQSPGTLRRPFRNRLY